MRLQVANGVGLLSFGLTLRLALAATSEHAAATALPGPDGIVTCARGDIICVGGDPDCDFTDLQQAIDSAPDGSDAPRAIFIAQNRQYLDQTLFIVNRNVQLIGGFSSCHDETPNGTTTLDGVASGSVIGIDADAGPRSVELRNLRITGGGGTDPLGFHLTREGGGVRIKGNVDVTISASTIEGNHASAGGGVFIDGADGATLSVTDGSIIGDNTAQPVLPQASGFGGGIYCTDGSVTLNDSGVIGNHAHAGTDTDEPAKGGGLYLDGCAFTGTAPGGDELGLRLNDSDDDGGGAYVSNDSDLNLEGTAAGSFEVYGNDSGHRGGGIHASESSIGFDATDINLNTAGEASRVGLGGGIYAFNSDVFMTSRACVACSHLNGNLVEAEGQGSALYGLYTGAINDTLHGFVYLERTGILFNYGNAFRIIATSDAEDVGLELASDLISQNAGRSLFRVAGPVPVLVDSVTIADNQLDEVFDSDQHDDLLRLSGSIIRESPGTPIASGGSAGGLTFECLMVNSGSGLASDPTLLVTNQPGFIDAGSNVYRLGRLSRAIDFCHALPLIPDFDIEGNLRGFDADQMPPFMPDATYDLGAYEWTPPADRVFANGFD